MTVVNPKSISGINSITMASGGDDLLTGGLFLCKRDTVFQVKHHQVSSALESLGLHFGGVSGNRKDGAESRHTFYTGGG